MWEVLVNYQKLQTHIDSISPAITRDLENDIKKHLDKCGLFYKSFSRVKSGISICEKLKYKLKEKGDTYRIQDLIGIRIAVYFKEDIMLCERLIERNYNIVNISRDKENIQDFGPQRINYVCELPNTTERIIDSNIWNYPIDKTFEIQIRTIFSEGWHEVEHDFRYKCQDDWLDSSDLSRTLNGILATLENCDWAISSLFSQVAYRHYKAQKWIPMLRNLLKLRITDYGDMEHILCIFNEDNEVAKQFFRFNRESFLLSLSDIEKPFKLRMDTIVYLINTLQIHNTKIEELTPNRIKECVKETSH